MRREPTEAERQLWRIVRGKRLAQHKFRRQQPIGRYIVDFVNFERRLIVEADGSQHADSVADRTRDGWLKEQGFAVLRLWNTDILNNPDGVVLVILAALDGSAATVPPLSLPPQGGGPLPLPQGERGQKE